MSLGGGDGIVPTDMVDCQQVDPTKVDGGGYRTPLRKIEAEE
jgi:hypothetical protein